MPTEVSFGNAAPLSKHEGGRKKGDAYQTPAPGHYAITKKHDVKFKASPTPQFGGNLCQISREKTGPAAEAISRQKDPSPNQYSISAGRQSLEMKNRSATFKFGSSERADGQKIYVSRVDTTGDAADPNRAAAGKGVPGPGAYASSQDRIKHKAPAYSFGLKPEDMTKPSTSAIIGPGSYQAGSCLGSQSVSTRPSSPGYSMGSSSREKCGEVVSPGYNPVPKVGTPGPAKYEHKSGMGRQTTSGNRSSNAYSFGSGEKLKRDRDKGVPGPGQYQNSSMLGIQASSTVKTYGGFKFGTSDRQAETAAG